MQGSIKAKLYIEGIKIPDVGAITISYGVGAPATANFAIKPAEGALRLKAGSRVIISVDFKIDGYEFNDLVLFIGRLAGVGESVSVGGRQVTLTATGYSSILDQIKQFHFVPGEFGILQRFEGAGDRLFAAVPSRNYAQWLSDVLTDGANNGPRYPSLSHMRGLVGGVIRALESMVGVPGQSLGVTDFITVEAYNARLLNQIYSDNGDAAVEVFKKDTFWKFITNRLSVNSAVISALNLLQNMLSIVGYNSVEISPRRVLGRRVTEVKELLAPEIKESLQRLDSTIEMLYAASVDVVQHAMRVYSELTDGTWLSSLITYNDETKAVGENLTDLINEFREGVTEEGEALLWLNRLELELLQLKSLIKSETITITYSTDGLYSIYLFPNSPFIEPPICNVIFPTQYNSLSWQRNFYQEPTRLCLRTSSPVFSDQDPIIAATNAFFAPEFYFGNKVTRQEDLQQLNNIMEHEKFTGPLPVIANVPELSSYVNLGDIDDVGGYLAHTLFLINRMKRGLSLRGPFNPFPVVGLPMVVFTSWNPKDNHLIGQLVGMTHVLDPSGTALTTYSLTNLRLLNSEDDIFYEGYKVHVTKRHETQQWFIDAQELKEELERVFGDSVPYPDNHLDKYYSDFKELGAKLLILLGLSDTELGRLVKATMQVGDSSYTVIVKEAELVDSSIVPFRVVDPDGVLREVEVFSKIRVEVLVTTEVEEKVNIEDHLLPKWYSDQYRKDRVGEFYEDAIGCDSIYGFIKRRFHKQYSIFSDRLNRILKAARGNRKVFYPINTTRDIATTAEVYDFFDQPSVDEIFAIELPVEFSSDRKKLDTSVDPTTERRKAVKEYIRNAMGWKKFYSSGSVD